MVGFNTSLLGGGSRVGGPKAAVRGMTCIAISKATLHAQVTAARAIKKPNNLVGTTEPSLVRLKSVAIWLTIISRTMSKAAHSNANTCDSARARGIRRESSFVAVLARGAMTRLMDEVCLSAFIR